MALLDPAELDILGTALETMGRSFEDLPAHGSETDLEAMRSVLERVAERMGDNYPYHHPLYAGQMLKPPHPVARLAYAMALWLNPNNHALDGGRASSALETECVAALGRMFGFERPLGHLCGGGTMANLEALWVAGRLHPGKAVLASTQAHYTHSRISQVLGLRFEAIPASADCCVDLPALAALLERDGDDVGVVVATLGTTGVGAVDDLGAILELRGRYGFRVHVDAAYGGYFTIASLLGAAARASFDRIAEADSVVIDPHKHGLQPYGCGCVLFRDTSVGQLYKHDSPYTYFSSAEFHLGEISLECSRPGAAAVALWATQQLLPMTPGEAFSVDLDRSLRAARELWRRVDASHLFRALMQPQLDIVVFAVDADGAAESSELARRVFEEAARRDLHLALIELPVEVVRRFWPAIAPDRNSVTCLRSCLMKPEHLDWIDDIWMVLEAAARRVSR